MAYDTVTVKADRLTLSKLAYRHYGRRDPDLLDAAISANPEFAASLFLPVGAVVRLPTIQAVEEKAAPREIVRLFS